jgi:hypothetical protein
MFKRKWAISIALATFVPVSSALADELPEVAVPCGPVSAMQDPGAYRALTHDQWQAARMIFALAPDTPFQFPPGDGALIRDHEDGTATVVYLDGGDACAPVRISKGAVELLRQVKSGEISHAKGRM